MGDFMTTLRKNTYTEHGLSLALSSLKSQNRLRPSKTIMQNYISNAFIDDEEIDALSDDSSGVKSPALLQPSNHVYKLIQGIKRPKIRRISTKTMEKMNRQKV